MRRGLGWLLVVLGSLVTVVGAAAALAFGPDNRVETGPHAFTSRSAVIATAPAALAYSGPTLEVTAAVPDSRVFIGLGHDVDVRDYLDKTAYTRIDTIDVPWSTTTTAVDGGLDVAALPRDTDFWLVSARGKDSATLRFPMPDSAVDLLVMDAEGKPALKADLTFAVVQGGAFVTAVAAVLVGLGITVVGLLRLRHSPRRGRRRASGTSLLARSAPGGRRKANKATNDGKADNGDKPDTAENTEKAGVA